MKEVAAAAGVNQSTVSRALRNDPRVASATAERVRKTVQKLGYRPDPYVSAFTARVRGYRRSPQFATLGVLNCHPANVESVGTGLRRYFRGAQEQAHGRGFRVDVFNLPETGLDRLVSILHHRGIHGLLILPLPFRLDLREMNTGNLACATIDLSSRTPPMHHAVPDYYRMVQEALDRLKGLGYKRIGLCTKNSELLAFGEYLAASHLYWSLRNTPRRRALIHIDNELHTRGPTDREGFLRWVRREQPDAILSNDEMFLKWLREAGWDVPGDIGFASLGCEPPHGRIAGIDQCQERVGAAAVDLIISQIFSNEFGAPESVQTVFINGVWQDGLTVRRQ